MGDAGNERREAAFLLRLGAGERECAHGAAVECAKERDDLLAAGVVARQLERAFNGFGAGVAVEEPVRAGHGRHGGEAVGQVGERHVIKVRSGNVDEFGSLFLNGRDNFGMAMTGGNHGNAGGEVEKLVAVHVFNAAAFGALGHQRIGAGVAGRDEAGIGRNGSLRLGAGQGTDQFRSVLCV
jgi:hypothetical protein